MEGARGAIRGGGAANGTADGDEQAGVRTGGETGGEIDRRSLFRRPSCFFPSFAEGERGLRFDRLLGVPTELGSDRVSFSPPSSPSLSAPSGDRVGRSDPSRIMKGRDEDPLSEGDPGVRGSFFGDFGVVVMEVGVSPLFLASTIWVFLTPTRALIKPTLSWPTVEQEHAGTDEHQNPGDGRANEHPLTLLSFCIRITHRLFDNVRCKYLCCLPASARGVLQTPRVRRVGPAQPVA